MRKWLTLAWLLFGVGLLVYHYDRGPRHRQQEKAYAILREIRGMEKQNNWLDVTNRYDELLAALPRTEKPVVRFQTRLAKAKARIEILDLGTAIEELETLLDETANEYGENAAITRATRETLGKAEYMAAWILKTAMAPEKEWYPYSDRARQIFRYLAEHEHAAAYSAYEYRVNRTVNRMSSRM